MTRAPRRRSRGLSVSQPSLPGLPMLVSVSGCRHGRRQSDEAADFTVTMNSGKFIGVNAQTFYVTFGPKYISTAVIRVQANSRTDVSVVPGAVAFGTVAQGVRAPAQSVMIKYGGKTRDWKLIEVVTPPGPLEVQLTEVTRGGPLRGGAEYRVDV